MKKLIYIYLIVVISVSCETSEMKTTVLENQSEQTLMLTQQIFQHYTTYLTSKNKKEVENSAKLLLKTLNDLSKIDSDSINPFHLQCRYVFDSTCTTLDKIYFSSGKLGIAWNVQFDSFLNETNNHLKIINYEELIRNKNKQ